MSFYACNRENTTTYLGTINVLPIAFKVKVVVQFKGREMQHKELGRDLLQKIFQPIEDIAAMESTPKVQYSMFTLQNTAASS